MDKYIFIEGFSTDKVLEEKEEMLRRLPGYRVEKALKIKNKEAMAQSIVAGRLLVNAVSQKLCISEEETVRLLDSESHSVEDRRIVSGGSANMAPDNTIYYSISHSGEKVAIAISSDKIGVDIECKDDKNFRVTKRMFSEEEIEYIGDSQQRFRWIWTIKEAFLKCTGEGIVVPLNSFGERIFKYPDGEDNKIIEDIVEIKVYGKDICERRLSGEIISRGYEMAGRRYRFYTYDVSTEYAFTVCVDII